MALHEVGDTFAGAGPLVRRQWRQSSAIAEIEEAEKLAGAAVLFDPLREFQANLGGADDDVAVQAAPGRPPTRQVDGAVIGCP